MKESEANLNSEKQASSCEVLSAERKERWHKVGCYSILAAVPAMVVPHLPEALSESAKTAETSFVGQVAKLHQRLNSNRTRPALLKRQSGFRLPHQSLSLDMVPVLAGNDDCPGRVIPGGAYTASSPYTDSGNTTGANDTVSALVYYYYYWQDAFGPDHVYSFILTARGANPQIQVSTTSESYIPLTYVLYGGVGGECPAGTGHTVYNATAISSNANGTATINADWMNSLPLNVPLYLFVDSARNDATGSGPYTLRMQDVTIGPASCSNSNPIDCTDFMVRQHYRDFLNREPDNAGLTFWTNEITSCGGDAHCVEVKHINVSAAFFLSIEFQQTGYLVYKTYAAAFGPTRIGSTVPLTRSEFLSDVQRVGQGVVVGATGWKEQLEANQTAYFNEIVQRPDFVTTYPATMGNLQFVDALNANTGNALSTLQRDQLVKDLTWGATRAEVLHAVVENADFTRAHFNRAFVLMQYFGYLRRNPNDPLDNNFDGYNFWLSKLDQFNGNFIQAEMVKAFITSTEYRQRFGP